MPHCPPRHPHTIAPSPPEPSLIALFLVGAGVPVMVALLIHRPSLSRREKIRQALARRRRQVTPLLSLRRNRRLSHPQILRRRSPRARRWAMGSGR